MFETLETLYRSTSQLNKAHNVCLEARDDGTSSVGTRFKNVFMENRVLVFLNCSQKGTKNSPHITHTRLDLFCFCLWPTMRCRFAVISQHCKEFPRDADHERLIWHYLYLLVKDNAKFCPLQICKDTESLCVLFLNVNIGNQHE